VAGLFIAILERWRAAMSSTICARHTGVISADYGSCDPLHWPHTGVSQYGNVRREERLARLSSMRESLRICRTIGSERDCRMIEADMRALEQEINYK
jgi:hypothetical protein